MSDDKWTRVSLRDDITEEIREITRSVVDGWYAEGRVDWGDVWDRVDGRTLDDGTRIDMGEGTGTEAFKELKNMVRRERRDG